MFNKTETETFGLENGKISFCLRDWDTMRPRHPLETAWDLTLIMAIFVANVFIIFIVCTSPSLWRPRHFLMMALCVANLFLGLHQLYGLALDLWPEPTLCVIYRMTEGVPVTVNSLLSALVSIDRFIAARFPFFYESNVKNFQIMLISAVVATIGIFLTAVLTVLGFMHPLIHLSSWLLFLPFTLTASGVVILYCNAAVLRIARRKMMSAFPRLAIGDCFYAEDSDSELSTSETALDGNDELNEQNSQSGERQCLLPHLQPYSGARVANVGITDSTDSSGNTSLQFLRQDEPRTSCIQQLSSSVKFARAVFIMTAPVLIFFTPIAVIIPLKYANDTGWCDFDETVKVLWNYLLFHLRSIFPLQCVTDPVIYLTFSKQSRHLSSSVVRRWWSHLCLQQQSRATPPMTQV